MLSVLISWIRTRLGIESGQDLLEYALLGGMIAAGILVAAILFGPYLSTMADGIGACIDFTAGSVCDPGP